MKAHIINDLTKLEKIVNMRVDQNGFLEKRKGTKLVVSMPYKIRGALSVSTAEADMIYIVAGTRLYRLTMGSDGSFTPLSLGVLSDAVFESDTEQVEIFMFTGKICVLAGGEYYVYDGSTLSKVSGYIPLIMKNVDNLGNGEEYERVNMLTNKVRMRFIVDGTSREHRIDLSVASVDAVYIGSTLLTSEEYSCSIGANYTTVTTTHSYSFSGSDNDLLQVYFTLNKTDERSRVTSCTKAAIYGGDTDSRVFLWGGSEGASMFPSEPSDAENGQSISYDYFPTDTALTVGDGNQPICGVCRQFDRLAIFTGDSAYYTYPHDDGIVNEIRRYSFPILPLNSDIGATEAGGAVLVENEPYSLCRNSLYKFKSTSVRDERLAIRIEPPEYLGFSSGVDSLKLYADKLRGELWCYDSEKAAIYNARKGCWYLFEGFTCDRIFTFLGEAAYFKAKKIYLSTDAATDLGNSFNAYCESGWLDLGNAFSHKDIQSFGVVIGSSSSSRSASVTLSADCGVFPDNDTSSASHPLRTFTASFTAPPSDSPSVFTSRANLRRVHHLKLKLSVEGTGLREVMVMVGEETAF